jgi:hypothetical protein
MAPWDGRISVKLALIDATTFGDASTEGEGSLLRLTV